MIPDIPVFCKVAAYGREGPCKIKFEYKNSGNLCVFASLSETEPDFSNASHKLYDGRH